ncbi:uncharacterized protein [Choristoneura fumiferana]|uniref:uncharacterized protein n=1 Tax=Choristoneura fumiferana TaxID=7141 RepID=UPI003D157476
MNILLFLFILHTVHGEFGTSYLKDRRLCHAWSCLNTKLGLTDSLPPQDQYSQVLKALMPEIWHKTIDSALNVCYCSSCKSRSYNNACPGQALLECTVDQLMQNCPEHSWKKNDACSTVTSLAGFKYMFTQGVYENIEANLPYDQRPTWFMRHYFRSKCCNLPELFNSSLLEECGFTHFMHYHRFNTPARVTESPYYEIASQLPAARDGLNIVALPPVNQDVYDPADPLDCCDMSGFIQPSWRSECDFRLNWNVQDRLTIEKPTITTTTAPITTTTGKSRIDIKVLPRSCAEETCVFRKLNIVSESGTVDIDAFKQLLNNLTTAHPEWTKAKARVFTKCLTRIPIDYYEDCEINKVLACTFDVLSENCPTAPKNDPCKHASFNTTGPLVCQISSAKYVPKNRHQPCDLPDLVGNDVKDECLISTIDRLETIEVPNRRYVGKVPVPMCKKLTDSTTCLLKKMGVLNKYQFMDYFKMKANIRDFASTHSEWLALNDAYLGAFTSMPMYGEYCSSPKKLLNLIDTMLMTCPLSKRKTSPKCYKMFSEISNSPMQNPNATEVQLDQIFHQFQNIFLPKPTHQSQNILRQKVSNKMYDFGILDDGNAPPVKIIDVNPTARPIKVLLPVYQQIYGKLGGDMTINMHHDGMLRGGVGAGLARP